MKTLITVKNKLILASALLWLAVFSSSCQKEVLEPSHIEPPRFYVETEMQGKPLQIYSGKNDFITAPELEQAKLLNVSVFSLYSSNFTNWQDTFQVGLMDVQFPFINPVPPPSMKTLETVLNNTMNSTSNVFVDFPGVGIRYVINGILYTTPSDAELQNGSYFHISKIEEYTPPGAGHAMKKVDVTFQCRLVNYNNEADNFWLENGKATLLFDYLPK